MLGEDVIELYACNNNNLGVQVTSRMSQKGAELKMTMFCFNITIAGEKCSITVFVYVT